jgi:hypothetical protein
MCIVPNDPIKKFTDKQEAKILPGRAEFETTMLDANDEMQRAILGNSKTVKWGLGVNRGLGTSLLGGEK